MHTRNPQVHGPGHMQAPPPKPAGPRATVLRRPRESGLGVARGPGSQGGGRSGGPGVGRGEVGGIPSPCLAGCDEGSLGLVILLSLTLGYFEQEITGDYDRHCRGATLPGWASLTPGQTGPPHSRMHLSSEDRASQEPWGRRSQCPSGRLRLGVGQGERRLRLRAFGMSQQRPSFPVAGGATGGGPRCPQSHFRLGPERPDWVTCHTAIVAKP